MASTPTNGISGVNRLLYTPIPKGTAITIPSISDTLILQNGTDNRTDFLEDQPQIITVSLNGAEETTVASGVNTSATYTPQSAGVLVIRYKGTFRRLIGTNPPMYPTYNVAFTITVVPNEAALARWNIRTVTERVLSSYKLRLQSEPQKYFLDPTQAAALEQIEAPEFAFTGQTLKGALDQIGGYIHAIPRLIRGASGKLDTIHFDMLGGTTLCKLATSGRKPCGRRKWNNIESYATDLDCSVENLLNSLDPAEGGVVEPYADGFISVRAEGQYDRITDETMVVPTKLPINTIEKLEILSPFDNTTVYDITGYVFEGAEYGRLSSYQGNYPTSKAYALYYDRGSRNIKGLSFKSPNVIDGSQSNYAITNILKAVSGQDITTTQWASAYPRLQFRITYTPIFRARIPQHKPNYTPGEFKRSLIYNQGANLVETRYLGENLKGTAARTGNVEELLAFRLPYSDLDLIPNAGELWNADTYVSGITIALYPTFFIIELSLSKDFNRLSQYIGVNSEWRAYEVSENKAYHRDCVYVDHVIVGGGQSDGKQLFNPQFITNTLWQFDNTYSFPLSAAVVQTYDADGNVLHELTLPVVSTAFGNTLSFNFAFEDNYSAGVKSAGISTGGVNGFWNTDAPYCDYYGRIATIGFTLYTDGTTPTASSTIPFDLPDGAYGTRNTEGANTPTNDRLVLQKDGREIIGINYCVEFVTSDKTIIIGPALAKNCPAVRGRDAASQAAFYIVPTQIGKFDRTINLSTATKVFTYQPQTGLTVNGNDIILSAQTATASGSAWAIADSSTGEILLAQNMSISSGATITLPTLTLTHDLI